MNDCSSSQEQMLFFRLYFNRITEQQYDNLILVGCMMLQTLFGCNILQCIASWVTPTFRWPSLQVSSWVTCSCRTLHRTRGTMVKVWGCDTCYTGSGSEGFFSFSFFSFFFFSFFSLSIPRTARVSVFDLLRGAEFIQALCPVGWVQLFDHSEAQSSFLLLNQLAFCLCSV